MTCKQSTYRNIFARLVFAALTVFTAALSLLVFNAKSSIAFADPPQLVAATPSTQDWEGYENKHQRNKALKEKKLSLKMKVNKVKKKYSRYSVIPLSSKMMKKMIKYQKQANKTKTLSDFKISKDKVDKQILKIKKKYNSLVVNQNKDTRAKNHLTASKGVFRFNGRIETYYSQKVLPGHGLKIPGRHVGKYGTIRDKYNYICVAMSDRRRGYVYRCSLGLCKVYDSGCAPGITDIYVNW